MAATLTTMTSSSSVAHAAEGSSAMPSVEPDIEVNAPIAEDRAEEGHAVTGSGEGEQTECVICFAPNFPRRAKENVPYHTSCFTDA